MASISYYVPSAGSAGVPNIGVPSECVAGTTAPVAGRCSFSYDQVAYREVGQILRDLDLIRTRIRDGDYNYDATTVGALTGTI